VRLVLVAGFTQTPSSWDGVRAALPSGIEPDAVEVPRGPDFETAADALARIAGAGVWCGYSMGGRLALYVALRHPHLVDALVLVSTTPGIADATQRAARVTADEELARAIERDGVEAFLGRWLAQPMFAGVARDAPGIADRAGQTAAELAHTLRTLGTGAMPPVWDRLHELTMPVLIVTGSQDTKFDAIGDEMAARITNSPARVRLDCGHAVALEMPTELAHALHDFTRPAASSSDMTS
jgi:2-succinyl-6-hydroxy-2,4-cyclohexadiene-1-carboxylate synthase